jgi:hypothetical protein
MRLINPLIIDQVAYACVNPSKSSGTNRSQSYGLDELTVRVMMS